MGTLLSQDVNLALTFGLSEFSALAWIGEDGNVYHPVHEGRKLDERMEI